MEEAMMTAKEQVGQQGSLTPLLPLPALREKILSGHSGDERTKGMARLALEGLEWGLGELGKLGHQLGVVQTLPPPPVAFPKMLYRGEGKEMEQTVVDGEAAEKTMLGDGWRDHPTEQQGPVGGLILGSAAIDMPSHPQAEQEVVTQGSKEGPADGT